MPKSALVAGLALTFVLVAPVTAMDLDWRNDIREALSEAEGRGVPLLVYLSRDD